MSVKTSADYLFPLKKDTLYNHISYSLDHRWDLSEKDTLVSKSPSRIPRVPPTVQIEVIRSTDGTLSNLIRAFRRRDIRDDLPTDPYTRTEASKFPPIKTLVVSLGGVSNDSLETLRYIRTASTMAMRQKKILLFVPEKEDTVFMDSINERMNLNSWGLRYNGYYDDYKSIIGSPSISWITGTHQSPSLCVVGPRVTIGDIHHLVYSCSGADILITADPPLEAVALDGPDVLDLDENAESRAGVITEIRKILNPKIHVYPGHGSIYTDTDNNQLIGVPRNDNVLNIDYNHLNDPINSIQGHYRPDPGTRPYRKRNTSSSSRKTKPKERKIWQS